MIKFRCPHCEQKLGVPDNYAGRRIRCNKCNEPSRVPVPRPIVEAPSPRPTPTPAPAGIKSPAPIKEVLDADQLLTDPNPMPEIELVKRAAPPIKQGLEFIEEDPEDQARQEAIRLARQQRTKGRTAKESKPAPQAPGKDTSSRTPALSIIDNIPEVLRLPLGLAASVIITLAMIGGWVICSRTTSNALCFVALFIPIAAAMGLRIFTVDRSFVLGIFAVVIGLAGIAAGKYAIAKYVVIPYSEDFVNEEVLQDLDTLLADPKHQLPQGESAKFYATDGDFLTCIALAALVDEDQADPVAARKWALYTLRASNKTNIYAHLTTLIGSGPEVPQMPEMLPEEEAMFDKAYAKMGEWADQESELQMTRKYFPALSKMADQCETQRLLEKPDTAMKFALLATFGLFDVIWILLGMGLGYVTVALD